MSDATLRLEVIELDPSDPLSKLAEEAQGKMQAAVADLGQRYPDLLEFAQEPPWWKSEPDINDPSVEEQEKEEEAIELHARIRLAVENMQRLTPHLADAAFSDELVKLLTQADHAFMDVTLDMGCLQEYGESPDELLLIQMRQFEAALDSARELLPQLYHYERMEEFQAPWDCDWPRWGKQAEKHRLCRKHSKHMPKCWRNGGRKPRNQRSWRQTHAVHFGTLKTYLQTP